MDRYPVKRGDTVTLLIESLAFGAKGVARVEGYTVFVERGIPGQEVEAVIVKRKKSYAEARIRSVIKPSPYQVEPRCSHFGICGGCVLQHLDYDAQLEAKRAQVQDCLVRLGDLPKVPVEPTLPSPDRFHYRNKMEFSFSTRWLTETELAGGDEADRFGLGLHVPRRFDRVVDIQECHLYPPEGSEILRRVRSVAAESGLPVYSTRTHQGFWRFLALREGVHTGERMVHLVTHLAPDGSREREAVDRVAAALTDGGPTVTTFVHGVTGRRASVSTSEETRVLAGKGSIQERILDFTYEIEPGTFFQTNTRGAERLFTEALDRAALGGGETVWDLYCGVGALSLPLAARAGSVRGIELVPEAVRAARRNAEKNGVKNAVFETGDVRKILAGGAGSPPDVVVVNPPREGLHPKVAGSLRALAPSRLVYISCNPATLARDLRIFVDGGYRCPSVQPVDMFPHTAHVECVTVLER